MKTRILAVALLGAISSLAPSGAWAQVGLTYSDLSSTLTTTAANCVPPDASRKALIIQNLSGGNIGFCYRAAATPGTACTPAIASAGTFTLATGVTYTWPLGNAPTNGLDCIGAGSAATSIVSGK